jgi:hypothetical protein
MKTFFTTELLNEFRNHSKINTALNGGELMNFYEFMNWFSLGIIRNDKDKRRESINVDQHNILIAYFKTIAISACENQIGGDYAERAMINLLESDDFDMIVILAPHSDKLKRDEYSVKPDASFRRKLNHILGFMIVEKGECKKMPMAYSINLICTRTKHLEYKRYSYGKEKDRERTRGGILLGFYLYCSKKRGQTHGILELADGYMNTAGFFSYSKQGFVKDLTLFGTNCFNDQANLPMSVRLDKYSFEELINHASGDKSVELKTSDIEDDTGLIHLVPKTELQKIIQREYANFCQMTYQLPYVLNGRFTYDKTFVLDRPLIKIRNDFISNFKKKHNNADPKSEDFLEFFKENMNDLRLKFIGILKTLESPPSPSAASRKLRKARKTAKAHIEAVSAIKMASKTRSKSRSKSASSK